MLDSNSVDPLVIKNGEIGWPESSTSDGSAASAMPEEAAGPVRLIVA